MSHQNGKAAATFALRNSNGYILNKMAIAVARQTAPPFFPTVPCAFPQGEISCRSRTRTGDLQHYCYALTNFLSYTASVLIHQLGPANQPINFRNDVGVIVCQAVFPLD